MKLERAVLSTGAMIDWKAKIQRALYQLKDSYPGNNTDMLGRQLISHLSLKNGVSSMQNGILYSIMGVMKNTQTLALYISQPQADTEVFDIDLTELDTFFQQKQAKEWK